MKGTGAQRNVCPGSCVSTGAKFPVAPVESAPMLKAPVYDTLLNSTTSCRYPVAYDRTDEGTVLGEPAEQSLGQTYANNASDMVYIPHAQCKCVCVVKIQMYIGSKHLVCMAGWSRHGRGNDASKRCP